MDKLPVFQLVLNEDNLEAGVQANALVSDPANGFAFVAFSKQAPQKEIKLAADKMKRNVTGVLLAPDQLIYRRDERLGEYNVMFTKDTIEAIVRNYSKNLRFSNVNLEHEVPVGGVHMVESWLTGDPDKSQALGFSVPQGSWMATFHIEDERIWQGVLEGTFTGFSIEGLFGLEPVAMSQEEPEIKSLEALHSMLHRDDLTDEQKIARVEKIVGSGN